MIHFEPRPEQMYVAVLVDGREMDKLRVQYINEDVLMYEGHGVYIRHNREPRFHEITMDYYLRVQGVAPKKKILEELTRTRHIQKFEPAELSTIIIHPGQYLQPRCFQLQVHGPAKIYIYGRDSQDPWSLFVNGWCAAFTRTIKKGRLVFYTPRFMEREENGQDALYVGLSKSYRFAVFRPSLHDGTFYELMELWLKSLFALDSQRL